MNEPGQLYSSSESLISTIIFMYIYIYIYISHYGAIILSQGKLEYYVHKLSWHGHCVKIHSWT